MEEQRQNCILCNGIESTKLYSLNPYSLVKCLSCGLIYVNPLPEVQELKKINQEIYSSSDYRKRYFKDERFFTSCFKAKLKIIERIKPEKGKILDIGCSYGFFLEMAKQRGWDIYGIEMNPIAGSYVRDKFKDRIYVGELKDSDFPTHLFDVITLWDVLEHIENPIAFLEQVKSYLMPGGLICIQSPNIDSLIAKLKGKAWDWLTPGDHLYYFTPKTLVKIVESLGFKIEYLTTWEPIQYFIDSLFSFNEYSGLPFVVYRKTVVRVMRKLFFFIFIPFQSLIKNRDRGALILLIARNQDGAGH